MTNESTAQETNLYITVVPGHRIELDFLKNPSMEALFELEGVTRIGLKMYYLSSTQYMLVGSKVHNLEQIGRQLKKTFEDSKFSFTVRGQIDLNYRSIDL